MPKSLKRFLRRVFTLSPTDTAADAARLMRDQRVGCLVVVKDDGSPVGMLTDRDLAVRVIAEARDPAATKVSEVFSIPAILLEETDGLDTAIRKMHEHGVRRLPIADEKGGLVGMITADDVMLLVGQELVDTEESRARAGEGEDSDEDDSDD